MNRFVGTLTPDSMPIHRATIALALLTLTATTAATLCAQSVPVTVGDRVRITTPAQTGSQRYVGSVVAVQGDSLTVHTASADAKTLAIADIAKLEVSAGKRGNGRRGMLYGTLIGAGAGAIVGAATYQKPDCAGATWFCDTGRGADTFAGGLVGGVLGVAVGGIWGVMHPTERWVPRPSGSAARIGVIPTVRGATVTLSARF